MTKQSTPSPESTLPRETPGPGHYGTQGVPYYYGNIGMAAAGGLDTLLGELTLSRVLRIIRKRWLTILLVAIFAVIAAFYYLSKATPVYRATATIEMTVRRPRIMGAEGAVRLEDRMTQSEEFTTRLEKFQGRRMFGLAQKQFLKMRKEDAFSPEDVADILQNADFKLIRDSRLVTISLNHPNPAIAADGANAFAKATEEMAMEENRSVSENAVAWLRSQAMAQRKTLDKTEQVIVEFRKTNQIAALENEARNIGDAIAALNQDLVQAENEQIKTRNILAAINDNRLNIDNIGQLPSSVPRHNEISTAIQQWAEAVQVRDTLLVKYTDKHPRVKSQQDLIAGLQKQLEDTVARARETAAANLEMATQQATTLSTKKKQLGTDLSEIELKIIEYKARLASLDRERDAADVAFQGILNRIEEARLAADEDTATVQIAELAIVPTLPVSPNRMRILALAIVLGLGAGGALALLKDIVDDHIVSPHDIELGSGVDVLGAIPRIKSRNGDHDLDLICLNDKTSQTAELFAGIRGMLDLPPLNEQTGSLVVTSTEPGEGKTFTATNLAIMSACAGRKTLLIDFDLRRPRLRTVFGIGDEHPNLLHTLAKNDVSLFPKLPAPSACENLDVIVTSADTAISPAEILGSRFIGEFQEWAQSNYERIIFDSPPLGVLADSIVLSGLCQGVLLVCQPNKTRRSALRHVIRRFQKVNGNILGVVINNVDLRHGDFKNYRHYGCYSYNYTDAH